MGKQLKRGISDVVTTVLIILLALAAVVILWTFLRGEVQKGSENIAGASECLGLDLQAKSCVYNKTAMSAKVSVEYVSGDAEITEVSALLDVDGERVVTPLASVPVKNGLGSVVIVDATKLKATSTPEQVSFVAKIKVAQSGEEKACPQPSLPVACTIVA